MFTKHGFLPAGSARGVSPGIAAFALDEIAGICRSCSRTITPYHASISAAACPEIAATPLSRCFGSITARGFCVRHINQTSQPIAASFRRISRCLLSAHPSSVVRPFSYDGYALYNWKRFDPQQAIALGNIDTIQNFVHLYDEHWFILVHVAIEAIAARIMGAIALVAAATDRRRVELVSGALVDIASAIRDQLTVLRRLPEKMDPALYHRTFRPYIRFFENVGRRMSKRR